MNYIKEIHAAGRQRSIFRRLSEPPKEERASIKKRYSVVLRAAQEAVGTQLGADRKRQNVLIRTFIAYRLRRERFTLDAIGMAMNRSHSSVVHYVNKKMADMLALPGIYREELGMYNKMNEILEKHEDS